MPAGGNKFEDFP